MLLHALIFISLQCAACFGCKLKSIHRFSTESSGLIPAYCLELTTAEDIAICLLQVNGIRTLMGCSIDSPDKALNWTVTPGSTADELQLVPGADTYKGGINQWTNPTDGRFPATPRAILYETTSACVYDQSFDDIICDFDLLNIFNKCPFDNYREFLDCLCCENVMDGDFVRLQWYIEHLPVGDTNYLLRKPDYRWTCENTLCRRKGKINLELPRALIEWRALQEENKWRRLEDADTTRTFPPDGSEMEPPSRTPTSRTPLPTDATLSSFSTYDVTFEEETETQTGNGESTTTPLHDEDEDGGEEDAASRFAPCWKALVFWLLAWVMYNIM